VEVVVLDGIRTQVLEALEVVHLDKVDVVVDQE
jgi:hypothetical protein